MAKSFTASILESILNVDALHAKLFLTLEVIREMSSLLMLYFFSCCKNAKLQIIQLALA